MKLNISRRSMLRNAALAAGAGLIGWPRLVSADPQLTEKTHTTMKGKFQHSVCRWCYNDIPLEELCERSKEIGIKSIEITSPADWPTIQRYGLTCALGTGKVASIPDGFNEPANHEKLTRGYIDLIRAAAENGVPNVIVFSGNRRDISDKDGLENCAVGLERVVKEAERRDVMIVMELLNSKRNHPDYQCDKTPWGAALVDKVGSSHFKLLYDIYHMQIMEGDVIATIREYKDYIAHYHTGGVPGRHEINDSQELNYPAIMKAIVKTGYTGYVAQEFVPTYDDKIKALAEGIRICEV